MPSPDVVNIPVTLKGSGNDRRAVPSLSNPMHVGQTVQYTSTDGTVRIEFSDNLDREGIRSGNILNFQGGASIEIISENPPVVIKLKSKGVFKCHCFIKPTGEAKEIGWKKGEVPESGGEHDVDD